MTRDRHRCETYVKKGQIFYCGKLHYTILYPKDIDFIFRELKSQPARGAPAPHYASRTWLASCCQRTNARCRSHTNRAMCWIVSVPLGMGCLSANFLCRKDLLIYGWKGLQNSPILLDRNFDTLHNFKSLTLSKYHCIWLDPILAFWVFSMVIHCVK